MIDPGRKSLPFSCMDGWMETREQERQRDRERAWQRERDGGTSKRCAARGGSLMHANAAAKVSKGMGGVLLSDC